jgi:hypothetical protein
MNTFPDGVVIHPKHEKNLTSNIFTLRANPRDKLIADAQQENQMKKSESSQTLEELHLTWETEKEKEQIKDDDQYPQKEQQPTGRKVKTMFDHIVDKKEAIKDEDIVAVDFVPDAKSYAETKREELKKKKTEAKKKLGLKTPYGNVKKAILEEYSLKEGFKDRKESKDKKGGGGGSAGGVGEPPAAKEK